MCRGEGRKVEGGGGREGKRIQDQFTDGLFCLDFYRFKHVNIWPIAEQEFLYATKLFYLLSKHIA